MREIRLYGSEGGGAGYSPYPYQNPSRVSAGFPPWLKTCRSDILLGNDANGWAWNLSSMATRYSNLNPWPYGMH